jgi:hypothetical protein
LSDDGPQRYSAPLELRILYELPYYKHSVPLGLVVMARRRCEKDRVAVAMHLR